MSSFTYSSAIRKSFEFLLDNYSDVFVLGQGLWSPWYVGNTMKDLDKIYGQNRIIDTPVSESAVTGIAVGASLVGKRPIVVHPRMDFMLYAMDSIVNQAAKWSNMTGGQAHPALTVRAIINRGGEQGAQHSQALHSWFSHIPGLRVVMPSTVMDAMNLMISSVLCDDPVVFIDDRWLYDIEDSYSPPEILDLNEQKPIVRCVGKDVTLVGSGYSAHLCRVASEKLKMHNISAEVIDLRVVSPLDSLPIIESVKKTGRLIVVDGAWIPCGLASSIISEVAVNISPKYLKASPIAIGLPFASAPTNSILEMDYYPTVDTILQEVLPLFSEI